MSTTSRSGFPPTDDGPSSEMMDYRRSVSAPRVGELPVTYVGFWARFVAALIDFLILIIPQFVIFGALGPGLGDLFSIILVATYAIYFHSSEYQATLGKQALGIIVIDKNGQRLTPAHAAGRYLGTILCALTLGIGYLIIGFTEKKTGLHDMVASTYVIKKNK